MIASVERRLWLRFRPAQIPHVVAVRVTHGINVTVVDLSAGGLRFETLTRLLPGSPIHVALTPSSGEVVRTRGHVVRCHVSAVSAAEVRYQGAVRFDNEQPWVARDDSIRPEGEARSHGSFLPSGCSA